MNHLREWWKRSAGMSRKSRRDADLAAEIEAHLQMHIDDNLRTGMTGKRDGRR